MSTLTMPDLHLRRYRQIAEVLTRHGLGWLHGISGLKRFYPFRPLCLGLSEHSQPESLTMPERVRLAVEELGATFIKLGQFLSTRADLLPPEYQTELAKLQDSAPPFASDSAIERIEADLCQSVDSLFAQFDSEPLAAASIGQVHAATLPNGIEVVVKVRRPQSRRTDRGRPRNSAKPRLRDEPALGAGFRIRCRRARSGVRLYLAIGVGLSTRSEKYRQLRTEFRRVHIPRIFWEMTTSRVLVLERIRGVKVSDPKMLDANGIDRRALAERGTRVILKMIFDDGFFHADLHPCNFFIEPDGRFGLIDFGMVGTVDEKTKEHLAGLVLALTGPDYDQMVDALLEMGVTAERVDRVKLRRDLEHLIAPYYGRALER